MRGQTDRHTHIFCFICIYIDYIFFAVHSYTGEYIEYLTDSMEYCSGLGDSPRIQYSWKWSSKMKPPAVASETKGKKSIDPHATCVVYKERLLEFFSKHAIYNIRGGTSLDAVGTIINLVKIPYMCSTCTLSLQKALLAGRTLCVLCFSSHISEFVIPFCWIAGFEPCTCK